MDRCTVYETFYKVIEDSLSWGVGEKDYGQFVEGVVAMTETILKREEEIYKVIIEGFKKSDTIGVLNDSKSNVEFSE